MNLRQWADETLAEATGRAYRHDPVQPGTGGPAGNALLTAWTGLLLLVLFLVELVTLLNLRNLLSWHVVVGVVLVPLALLKTTSTGWRIVSYYAKRTPYCQAGPPPMLLRVLGPLVVLCTLALLGSGLVLIALGPERSRTDLMTVLGNRVNWVTVHQAVFLGWAAVTGLHTLGRLLPALRIITAPWRAGASVPGWRFRGTVVIATLLAAGVAAAIVLGLSHPWLAGGAHLHRR